MPTERQRILELALESLEARKRQIEEEMADLTRLMGGGGRKARSAVKTAGGKPEVRRRHSRFSKEEREKRSRRMKAYWEKWRAEKARQE